MFILLSFPCANKCPVYRFYLNSRYNKQEVATWLKVCKRNRCSVNVIDSHRLWQLQWKLYRKLCSNADCGGTQEMTWSSGMIPRTYRTVRRNVKGEKFRAEWTMISPWSVVEIKTQLSDLLSERLPLNKSCYKPHCTKTQDAQLGQVTGNHVYCYVNTSRYLSFVITIVYKTVL